jgi:hypothetical protein
MRRGFIGKMRDLAERTIQNCRFGMFLQKKIHFRESSSSKHSSILFSQREGPLLTRSLISCKLIRCRPRCLAPGPNPGSFCIWPKHQRRVVEKATFFSLTLVFVTFRL